MESVDDFDFIPHKNDIPLLSDDGVQPNAEWAFFTLGLRRGRDSDRSKLEIFGLNPQTCDVYHVIDFKLSDFHEIGCNAVDVDSDSDSGSDGRRNELPDDIAFAACGTKLFIVVGDTGTVYTCDISCPGPHGWKEGPRLNAPKRKPLLFALGQKLYVLSTQLSCYAYSFEKLDLALPDSEKKKRKRVEELPMPSWDVLPSPKFLSSLVPVTCFGIDREEQKIYFRPPNECEMFGLCVFNTLECKWFSYAHGYGEVSESESESESEEESEEEHTSAATIDPLVFNLLRIPVWSGCAPILYGKIFLIQNDYVEPGLMDFSISEYITYRKVALVGYNLKAPIPPSIRQRRDRRLKGEDFSYMTPKRITGLHSYFSNALYCDDGTGGVVHVSGGRFCFAEYFSDLQTCYVSSVGAAVFKLRLDHIQGDFPNELEQMNDYIDVVIDEPVLRPQGAVVQRFYKFAGRYCSPKLQFRQA